MLKRYLLALMLISLVAAVSATAIAQDNSSANPPAAQPGDQPDHHGHGRMDPARRTEMLTKQLNLTSDQQPKVLDILKSEQSQMESLRSDSSTSQDDRRSKMMDIHKQSNDQIRALLDSNQQKKWDEMQSRREQWQGHRQDGQAPPPPPSNSPQQN